MLQKRAAFREVFWGFDADRVACMTEADVQALLVDARLIRNQRKIMAVVNNARAVIDLREQGGLDEVLWSFAPAQHTPPLTVADIPSQTVESRAMAKELKRRGFQFVGPTTCYATMQAVGMVDDRPRGASPLLVES